MPKRRATTCRQAQRIVADLNLGPDADVAQEIVTPETALRHHILDHRSAVTPQPPSNV